MAFLLEIGAIRVMAEKTLPEWYGVRAGNGVNGQAFIYAAAQKRGAAKVGIGIVTRQVHQ